MGVLTICWLGWTEHRQVSEGTRLSTPEKVMEKLWDHARTRGGVNLATDVFSIIVWTGIAGYAVKRSLLPR